MSAGLQILINGHFGNTALAASLNSDGTAHYPNGVTSLSLVIAQTLPADSGQYHLVASNPVGGATTASATVLISADTAPPVVTFVQALGTPNAPPNSAGPSPYLVKALFNKRIMVNVGTFTIAGTTVGTPTFLQDVNAAALDADWREVILPTSGLTPGQSYTLAVSGVKDQTVTGNTIVTTNITFKAPALTTGLLDWDYYYLNTVTGSGVISDLTGNQYLSQRADDKHDNEQL